MTLRQRIKIVSGLKQSRANNDNFDRGDEDEEP